MSAALRISIEVCRESFPECFCPHFPLTIPLALCLRAGLNVCTRAQHQVPLLAQPFLFATMCGKRCALPIPCIVRTLLRAQVIATFICLYVMLRGPMPPLLRLK